MEMIQKLQEAQKQVQQHSNSVDLDHSLIFDYHFVVNIQQ